MVLYDAERIRVALGQKGLEILFDVVVRIQLFAECNHAVAIGFPVRRLRDFSAVVSALAGACPGNAECLFLKFRL